MVTLNFTDLILTLGLMGIAIALSAWQRLGLEWKLLTATLRTLIQLGILGYVLAVVLDPQRPNTGLTLTLILALSILVAVVTSHRISHKLPRLVFWVWGSLVLSTALVVSYAQLLIIQPSSWDDPQYLIPLVAVVLGSGMNSAAIAGEQLLNALSHNPIEIETHLSLGATPGQVVAPYRRMAIQAGLLPGLNAMMLVGMITLPGVLSGQLLAGASPLDAVSYQVLLLFLVVVADLMLTLLITQRICQQFFNSEAQLRQF
ncbi:MAG: iron export ABC transporter permease subunit FetB [Oscillatoriales cyanobacterium RM2_1_1]|nr:iron export ABC transporter permease subunit FetB [Oscillatoriales cyanobacterium SM2_3_0]NJO47561.1 iron export ABC transporter permease subunit FetB [Oscillatoriales cyanobacterium RM2_1_1]